MRSKIKFKPGDIVIHTGLVSESWKSKKYKFRIKALSSDNNVMVAIPLQDTFDPSYPKGGEGVYFVEIHSHFTKSPIKSHLPGWW